MRKILLLVLALLGMTLSGCGVDWFPAPEPVVADFSFTAGGTEVNGGTVQTSNAVTLAISMGPAKISVSGDPSSEYSVNGGAYTAAAGTVKDGDRVSVHHKAADAAKGVVTTTLKVGNKSATFSTTTASTSTVTAFSFSQANLQVAKSTIQTSPPVTVASTGAAPAISISGDASSEYSINGGAFKKTAGTVANGDVVVVRHTSSSADDTTVATTLTIGDQSDTFFSSTGAVVSETIDATGAADVTVYVPVTLHLVSGQYTIHIASGIAGYSLDATAATVDTANYFYAGMPDETVNLKDGQVIWLADSAPGAFSDVKTSTTVINLGNGTNSGTITYNLTATP